MADESRIDFLEKEVHKLERDNARLRKLLERAEQENDWLRLHGSQMV